MAQEVKLSVRVRLFAQDILRSQLTMEEREDGQSPAIGDSVLLCLLRNGSDAYTKSGTLKARRSYVGGCSMRTGRKTSSRGICADSCLWRSRARYAESRGGVL